MIRQYPLPLPHKEAMAADDFMVTASNREATAWIDQWPEWPAHCLVIHGPSGSGKTHLAQVWRARSQAQSLDPTDMENFWNEGAPIETQNEGVPLPLAGGVRGGLEETPSPAKTKDLLRKSEFSLPLPQGERDSFSVLIDNADKAAGIPAHEEALFHLYNRLKETKGSLLLTALHAPAQWGIGLADLRSRLLSIPAVGIAAPDDELLSALLIKQFRDRQIDLGADVVDYLLPRVERTPEAIRALVGALDRASLAEGRRITIALARKLLEEHDFLI